MRKKNAPVVIMRKDKKLFKTGHLAAFMLTGGTSAIYTAAKAATNAGYNARTRQLQAEAPEPAEQVEAHDRAPNVPPNPEDRARLAAARTEQQTQAVDAEWRAEHVPASREYKARHGQK